MRRWAAVLWVFLLVSCRLEGELLSTVVPTSQAPDETRLTQTVPASSLIEPVEMLPAGDLNPLDGAVLVEIPAGSFLMGAPPESGMAICEIDQAGCLLEDFEDENPPHDVFLSAFWIYKTEVTNAQYRMCVDAGGCDPPAFLEFYYQDQFSRHPVVYVRWYDADAYCRWAGGRLPAETEWEKAARGIDARIFPWGDAAECGFANLKGCGRGLTEEVGLYPQGASPYGVLDMAGNVAEWVADWYSPVYYADSPAENPQGPSAGEMKTARGGSWKNPFAGVRTTNRTANFPEVFSSGVGFRCVLDTIPLGD